MRLKTMKLWIKLNLCVAHHKIFHLRCFAKCFQCKWQKGHYRYKKSYVHVMLAIPNEGEKGLAL